MFSKIWLSKPHFENDDVDFFKKTMESNWISTVGPHIGDFEKSIEKFYHNKVHVAALNSGTSAIHLALKMLDIGAGDEVIMSNIYLLCYRKPYTVLWGNSYFY